MIATLSVSERRIGMNLSILLTLMAPHGGFFPHSATPNGRMEQ